MIERISIESVATFHPTIAEVLDNLKQFNYVFGSNGTGKTTISRAIADPDFSASCQCSWRNRTPLQTLVLNRYFVEKVFGESQTPGVFTLGEEEKGTETKIKTAKEELDKEQAKLTNLKKNLEGDDGAGGKKGDLAQLEIDFQHKCWAQKQKYDAQFQGAFTGYRNNAQNFKQKVLDEAESNTAGLKSQDDLEDRAATIFAEAPTKEVVIPTIDTAALLAHETNPILKKKVIGKDDVDIAAMIQKLGNSDWVRQGLPYYEANDRVCPFCQQDTTKWFAQSLSEYFDEAFEYDSNAINTIVSQYATDAAAVQSNIDRIIATPGKFLDVEKLKAEKSALDQNISANTLRLENKKKEPSKIIALESLDEVLSSISRLIDAANAEVKKHNATVDNLAAEQKQLTTEVWRFVVNELDVDLKQYSKNKEAFDKAIAGIETNIKETKGRIFAITNEIRELEKQTTSIQPTINAINHTLQQFGFDSFTLADAGDGRHYKLVRRNGEDAQNTLSEGERGFVVFLYFYHLLKGSFSESGMTTDRVVVFDDPVSSLDSDVLFIVSSLIKEVCEEVRSGVGHIKQVFVLTHNIYFHKEVTFDKRPKANRPKDESFWIIRKVNSISKLARYDDNPIKTSYELLWMDVRDAQDALQDGGTANQRIQNTLRRILEHYFTILGSIDHDDICAKFEGQEKVVCKSLFSWMSAGSHSVFEDAHITSSDAITEKYLRVFKAIFEKEGHLAHYDMMMTRNGV